MTTNAQSEAERMVKAAWPSICLLEVDDGLFMLWNYRPKVVIVGTSIVDLWLDAAARVERKGTT